MSLRPGRVVVVVDTLLTTRGKATQTAAVGSSDTTNEKVVSRGRLQARTFMCSKTILYIVNKSFDKVEIKCGTV